MSVISKMTFDNGSTKNLISSTFYGKCDTAAATAAKTVTIGGWDESVKDNVSGATIHIYFTNGNTATNPTLNIDSGGAHPIYLEEDVKASSFPAGIYALTLIQLTISSQETWCWLMDAKAVSAVSVPWSGVTNPPSTYTPSSHTHGNISNAGAITSTITIASGDKLIVADSSDSTPGKLAASSISFGSDSSKYLSNSGTWEDAIVHRVIDVVYDGTDYTVVTPASDLQSWLQETYYGDTLVSVRIGDDLPTSQTYDVLDYYQNAEVLPYTSLGIILVVANKQIAFNIDDTGTGTQDNFLIVYSVSTQSYSCQKFIKTPLIDVPGGGNSGKYVLDYRYNSAGSTYKWQLMPTIPNVPTAPTVSGTYSLNVPSSGDPSWTAVAPSGLQPPSENGHYLLGVNGSAVTWEDTTPTVTIASGDKLLIADSSDGNKVKSTSITFGSSTNTYLKNNGTWGQPSLTEISGTTDLQAIEEVSGQGLLRRIGSNQWEIDSNNYVTSSGVTSIKVDGGTGISTTPTTTVTSTGTYTVSLADTYGDTKNPYGSKTANQVLAAPNGSNGAPSFRALVAADIPSITKSKISDFPTEMTPTSHTHGAISNTGTMSSSTAVEIANGDRLVIARNTSGAVLNTTLTFGTATTTYLRNDGTWATPADTKVTQNATITSGNNYRLLLSTSATNNQETGTVNKAAALYYNPSIDILYAGNFYGGTRYLTRPIQTNGVPDVTTKPQISTTRANRLAFLPADQIIIEKTTDGGTTWVDAGVSDVDKLKLFSESRPSVALPLIDGERSINCGLRITITGMKYNVPENTSETQKYTYWNSNYIKSTERYCSLEEMYFWVNSVSDGIGLKVERATGAAPNTWTSIYDSGSTFALTGWSGNNYIQFASGVFGGNTTRTTNFWNYRLTFFTRNSTGGTTLATTYTTSAQSIMEIRGYGVNVWTLSNNYMANDHLYTFNYAKDATFPAAVISSTYIGIGSTATAANGDQLVVGDASDSNRVKRSSITLDTSDTAKYLRHDGTWATPESGGDVPDPPSTESKYVLEVDSNGDASWGYADAVDVPDAPDSSDGNYVLQKSTVGGGAGVAQYDWVSASYVPTSEKGAASGVATLDTNSKVPIIQSNYLYGKCTTAGSTAAKTASIAGYDETTIANMKGVTVFIGFNSPNTAANPTLNISGSGAHAIVWGSLSDPMNVGNFSSGLHSFTLVEVSDTYYWFINEGRDTVPEAPSSNGTYILNVSSSGASWSSKTIPAAPTTGTVTIGASGWSGNGPYSHSVTISGTTANSKIDLQPNSTVLAQMTTDGTAALYIENNNGTLTAWAMGAKPTASLTIQYTKTEVA